MQPSRRTFLTGLTALIAAPAIVRASSLMPVKVFEDSAFEFSGFYSTYSTGLLYGGYRWWVNGPQEIGFEKIRTEDFYAPEWSVQK